MSGIKGTMGYNSCSLFYWIEMDIQQKLTKRQYRIRILLMLK